MSADVGRQPLSDATESRAASILPRIPLVAATFVFGAIALRYLTDPIHAAAAAGIVFTSAGGITTARIGFAAFPLAFAILTASCLASRRRVLTGLYVVLTVVAVALAVRLLGIALDHSASQSARLIWPEVALLVFSGVGVRLELGHRRRSA